MKKCSLAAVSLNGLHSFNENVSAIEDSRVLVPPARDVSRGLCWKRRRSGLPWPAKQLGHSDDMFLTTYSKRIALPPLFPTLFRPEPH
jgi:hypothetical protein